jgi:hypothetical protein
MRLRRAKSSPSEDQFGTAFGMFLQEAGARLHDYMNVEPPVRRPSHISPEVLEDATRTLVTLFQEGGNATEVDPSNPVDPGRGSTRDASASVRSRLGAIISPTLSDAFQEGPRCCVGSKRRPVGRWS